MEHFDEAYKQVQKAFRCPICGKSYLKKDIELKGFLNKTYIFRAYCNRNHELAVAECVIFMGKKTGKPISQDDITDIQHEIKEFDGNFEKLFNTNK